MGERMLLEGVTCPRCNSPLVSIDFAADDDAESRRRIRSVDAPTLVLAGVVVALAVMFVPYVLGIGSTSVYQAAAGVLWIIALASMAFKTRSMRARRLATCHACEHSWRVSLPGGRSRTGPDA